MVLRGELSEHPVTALDYMSALGWIPRPAYAGQLLGPNSLEYALVIEIEGYGHRVAVGKTKAQAKRLAAEELLVHVLATMCPTPTKIRYATQKFAHRRGRSGRFPVQETYKCRCGWWHLTSHGPH